MDSWFLWVAIATFQSQERESGHLFSIGIPNVDIDEKAVVFTGILGVVKLLLFVTQRFGHVPRKISLAHLLVMPLLGKRPPEPGLTALLG